VFVADTANDRIQVFDSSGTFITKWGSSGTGDGEFNSPQGVAVDPSTGNVFVADTFNDRIQVFALT
jgi:DNA-binding beta-propeller fold protein YncE